MAGFSINWSAEGPLEHYQDNQLPQHQQQNQQQHQQHKQQHIQQQHHRQHQQQQRHQQPQQQHNLQPCPSTSPAARSKLGPGHHEVTLSASGRKAGSAKVSPATRSRLCGALLAQRYVQLTQRCERLAQQYGQLTQQHGQAQKYEQLLAWAAAQRPIGGGDRVASVAEGGAAAQAGAGAIAAAAVVPTTGGAEAVAPAAAAMAAEAAGATTKAPTQAATAAATAAVAAAALALPAAGVATTEWQAAAGGDVQLWSLHEVKMRVQAQAEAAEAAAGSNRQSYRQAWSAMMRPPSAFAAWLVKPCACCNASG